MNASNVNPVIADKPNLLDPRGPQVITLTLTLDLPTLRRQKDGIERAINLQSQFLRTLDDCAEEAKDAEFAALRVFIDAETTRRFDLLGLSDLVEAILTKTEEAIA